MWLYLLGSSKFVTFLAHFTYFEENRVGLWDHVAVCVRVCVRVYPP
jgi:hypothetical protein